MAVLSRIDGSNVTSNMAGTFNMIMFQCVILWLWAALIGNKIYFTPPSPILTYMRNTGSGITHYCMHVHYAEFTKLDICKKQFFHRPEVTFELRMLRFLLQFSLLMDVNELINKECFKCVISYLNLSNWFTHSHPYQMQKNCTEVHV